jgi:hypothetical protein
MHDTASQQAPQTAQLPFGGRASKQCMLALCAPQRVHHRRRPAPT